MSTAVLYICTGKYSIFWKEFYQSCERFFLPDQQKKYFVFSDTLQLAEDSDSIKIIHQKKMGWPFDTLKRFHLFDSISSELENFDFIFFFNANLVFKKTVSKDILYNNETFAELIVVKHPFFDWVEKPTDFPYERNRRSAAYIPKRKGKMYVFGAINGGAAKHYLEMIGILKKWVDHDLKRNIFPLWQDESPFNKYIMESKKNIRVLDYNYAYPEGHDLPLKDDIYVQILDKGNFGGHDFLREQKDSIPTLPKHFSIIGTLRKIKNRLKA